MKRLFLLMFFLATPAFAIDLYTSSTGSDTANNCQTIASPCNINNGLTNEMSRVVGSRGDTLYLCAGGCDGSGSATVTYTGGGYFLSSAVDTIPAGTSFTDALTIMPYTGETITFQPTNGSGVFYFTTTGIILKGPGLVLDGVHLTSVIVGVVNMLGNYERAQDFEIKNGPWSGIGMGYSASGGWTHYQEAVRLTIHDLDPTHACVAPCNPPHGIYIQASVVGGAETGLMQDMHLLVDGGEVYSVNSGTGNASGVETNGESVGGHTAWLYGVTVRGVKVHGNDYGMGFSYSPDALIYNNVVYSQTLGTGIDVRASEKVYNNTVYGNPWYGIRVNSGGSGAQVKNNILYSNAPNFGDFGTSTVCATNHGTVGSTCVDNATPGDPKFTNSGSGDFTLLSNSPAINNGTDLSAYVTTDKDGTQRPQGCCFDLGAYEVPGFTGLAFFNARTQRFTTSTFAAGALGGGAWGQVGSGLTVDGDGSNQFTASARATPGTYNDGIARELTYTGGGGYSGKLYCKVTVVSLGSHNDATDSLGCGFLDVNGTGPVMRASVYAGTTYLQIQKDVTGAYSSLITQIAGITIAVGDTLAMEWNGATGELWAGVNTLYYISPIDHTYDGLTLKPSLVATGDAKGDVADFGDILVGAGCVGCVITVTGPGSGTVCVSGQTCAISWTTSNISGTVDVYYLDAGGSQHLIASPAFDASPYAWTVNAPASTLNKIRVTQSSVSDDSDAAFTVLGTKTQFR